MSVNIIKEYINFKKECIENYANIILEKYYDEKIFAKLLNVYMGTRYFDNEEELTNSRSENKVISVINKHLVTEAKKIHTDENDFSLRQMLYIFGFIYEIEDVIKDISDDEILNDINTYREKTLQLSPINKENIVDVKKGYDDRLKRFLEKFVDKNFYLDYGKTSSKNIVNITIKHDVKLPKLYSEYAIENVFNRGLINENKLFIEYYLTVIDVLKDLEGFDYNNDYLVEFDLNYLEKDEKLAELLNIINNAIAKDKVSFKITYSDFSLYKESIMKLINEGYRFSLILDDEFKFLDNELLECRLFKYVIVPENCKNKYLELISNRIKIK